MADYTLSNVNVIAVSLCKGPANRKRIYLKKSTVKDEDLITLPARHDVIRKSDGTGWSTLYSVVAEPGWEERGGVGEGSDPDKTDVWASEDEIRKAAHSFMQRGALVNLQHQDLNAVGKVVENFIAPADMVIETPDGPETIKKGAWVIGIQPDDALRAAVDEGLIDGVSYEGSGVRIPVSKAHDPSAKGAAYRTCKGCNAKMGLTTSKCPGCGAAYVAKASVGTLRHERTIGSKGKGLFGMKGAQLPAYIQHVYNDLVQSGNPIGSLTYRKAVGIVQNWAAGHDGKGNKVSAAVQAKAAAAIAEWNKLKAQARADNIKKALAVEAGTLRQEEHNVGLMHKIAKSLGMSDEDIAAAEAEDKLTPEEQALLDETNQEDDVALTDEQKVALEKVGGLDAKVEELTKEDGRLARIESVLSKIAEQLPEKEQTEEEKREALSKSIETISATLEKTQADLATLASGMTAQGTESDLKKNDNSEAALAAALLG